VFFIESLLLSCACVTTLKFVNIAELALCGQRFQHDLRPESVQLMSSDATMERALNRNIIVTVNIIVLTALMSSTAVRKLQIPYIMWLLEIICMTVLGVILLCAVSNNGIDVR